MRGRFIEIVATAVAAFTLVALTRHTPQAQVRAIPGRASRSVLGRTMPSAVNRGSRPFDRAVEFWRDALATAVEQPGEVVLPGAVIVKFRVAVDTETERHVAADAGATGVEHPSYADFAILTIDPHADPEAVARRLATRPEVEYAEARHRTTPLYVPNDPLYAQQWNLRELDMERAWDINLGASPSVIVAVLDTGIAFEDVMLRYDIQARELIVGDAPLRIPASGVVDVPFAAAPDLARPGRFVAPHDFVWDDADPVDVVGHGTHVAGTIGQLTGNGSGLAGMAFNVRLMPVKVAPTFWDIFFGARPSGQDLLARGIRYAVDNGARVINMSIGVLGDAPNRAVEDALQYAVSHGTFVAIAAGNSGEADNTPNPTAAIAARIDGVVSVAAVGPGLERAFYSTASPIVEIAAPGGDTRRAGGPFGAVLQQSLDPDVMTIRIGRDGLLIPRFDAFVYRASQGTSMAAPHVAALAALLMSQGITRPAAIEAAMKRFATDKGPPGRDDEYGFGVINPRATLRGLGLSR